MRDLVFNVNSQKLVKSPSCDFKNIIVGSINYLNCIFTFNSDWNNCNKVVIFKDSAKEKPMLLKSNKCVIPSEFSKSPSISIRLIGQKGEQRIVTNTVAINQVSDEVEEKKKWQR